MSYFRDVYLKRVNRFGTNLQERILNKKEYDFHHFVDRSPNKVTVYIQDYKFEGVLQSKTYDEIETIDYFLTYKSISVPIGSVLKVRDINHNDIYSYWIVVAKDNFISAGYYRYTVIKLDREIRWITDEGKLFKTLVHISGSGAGGTNRRLISSTKIVQESVVYKPNQVLTLIMPDHDEIKRGIRINIGGRVWKISGFDDVTNVGVNYVTVEQDYTDDTIDNDKHLPEGKEPPYEDGIANGNKLERWTFDSNLREEGTVKRERTIHEQGKEPKTIMVDLPLIILSANTETAVDFRASYYDKPSDTEIAVEVKDTTNLRYNKINRSFVTSEITEDVETSVFVRLVDSPDIEQEFIIQIQNVGTATDFAVEGAARIKCGIPSEFYSKKKFTIKEEDIPDSIVIRELGYFTKNEQQFYKVEIIGSYITKNVALKFTSEDNEEYIKTINIESPWIGG